MNRILTNIFVSDIEGTKKFFIELLGFSVVFEESWFVMLSENQFELAIISNEAELVPSLYRGKPNGFYITFVLPNVDEVFHRAKELSIEVVQEPKDEVYGQRRMLLNGPESILIDVSSPIEVS